VRDEILIHHARAGQLDIVPSIRTAAQLYEARAADLIAASTND